MDNNTKFLFRTVLKAGYIIVKNGGETYRAEDTMKRMLASKGFKNISAFVSPTVIILGNNDSDDGNIMLNIKKRSSNLGRIELVNEVSRKFVTGDIDIYQVSEKLQDIENKIIYPYSYLLVSISLSCAIFAILIGGNYKDFFATLIVSSISFHLSEEINNITDTVFLGNFIASFIVCAVAFIFSLIGFGSTFDFIIVGSVLPLVPGVALTSGIRDFMSGDLLSGVAKSIEAVMIAIAIAFGVGTALVIFNFLGGI